MEFELSYTQTPDGDRIWYYGTDAAGIMLAAKPPKNQMRKLNKQARGVLPTIHNVAKRMGD